MTDEYGWCLHCGGHGAVIVGNRVNQHGRTVPNFVPCKGCDGQDRVTPFVEAQAGAAEAMSRD